MNLLSNFIKKKIENLLSDYLQTGQSERLRLKLSSDELALKDVYLNLEQLNKKLHSTPFKIKEGVISSLMIKIPWSSLFNSATEVQINDITIFLQLKDVINDPQKNLFSREIALQTLFKSFKAHVISQIKIEEKTDRPSFFKNLTTKIIDNLQFKLTNVVIKLELSFGISQPAFQIDIQEFNFYTSDAKFEDRMFFDRKQPQFKNSPISKVLKLDNFSLSIQNKHQQKIELLENYSENDKNKTEYKHVFKLNLDVHATIKTTDVQDDQPKFAFSIEISALKINLTERKIAHISEAIEYCKTFEKEHQLFYNYYMQKPKLRMTDLPEKQSVFKTILAKRWWLYCTFLVLKAMHVRKVETMWEKIKPKVRDKKKIFKNMKLPDFIFRKFKNPLRNILEDLLTNNWQLGKGLSNDDQYIDLETILLFVPENQLKQLVNQTCGSIIKMEQKKEKGVSFVKKMLTKVGLYKETPHEKQMVEIIQKNIEKDRNFDYNYQGFINFKVLILKINVMTEYGSTFSIEAMGIESQVQKHLSEIKATALFKSFRFYFQHNKLLHNIFWSSKAIRKSKELEDSVVDEKKTNNFIDCAIDIKNDEKSNLVDSKIKIGAARFEIKKEIFDQIYLFLKNNKKRITSNSDIGAKKVASVATEFEKTLKDFKTNLKIRITMKSIAFVLTLDSQNNRRLTLNTGELTTKFVITNSTSNHEYVIRISNTSLDYFVRNQKHQFIVLSLFVKANTTNNLDFEIFFISEDVQINVKSILLCDMLNSIAIFKEKNIKHEKMDERTILISFKVRHHSCGEGETLPICYNMFDKFNEATLQINKNKTLTILTGLKMVRTQSFSKLRFRYYRKKERYLLKVSANKFENSLLHFFLFENIKEFKEFVDFLFDFDPSLRNTSQQLDEAQVC